MFRVLLITKNRSLIEFCRKNLPDGFRLKILTKLNLRDESPQGIVVFDSGYLAEQTDGVVAAAAERYGAREGAVSLNIVMNEEHRTQSFSLYPENLQHIQAILPYRIAAGKVQGLIASEWCWFLEAQKRQLKQIADRMLTLGENQVLAERLAQLKSEVHASIRFPAFMHGRSQAIVRFREQILSTAASRSYLLLTGKEEIPFDDFLEYYGALIRPDNPPPYRVIDLAKTPRHLQAQAIWPSRARRKAGQHDPLITCINHIHLLSWQNQTALLTLLNNDSGKPDQRPAERARYILLASHDLAGFVRKGKFRQDLHSLLRKAAGELPALHERPEDISMIAAEYISRRGFKRLQEQNAEVAAKIMGRFDLSSGYNGLFMTLDLMNDLEKSKGLPVFELMGASEQSDAFIAARSFLREQVEPNPATLFQGLAGSEREALSLDYVERHYIAAVCARYGWQVTEAARHLGISRKTLYDKMRRYKLSRPESGSRRSQGRAS